MPNTPFEIEGSSLIWRSGGETLRVQAWGPDSVRVRASRMGPVPDTEWALLPPAEAPAAQIETHPTGTTLRNGALTVEVLIEDIDTWKTGYPQHRARLVFRDASGAVLFEEADAGSALQRVARTHRPQPGGRTEELVASFTSDPEERLVGMGLYPHELINLKGATFELAHRNSQSSIPFVLSSKGYGFLWHNPAIGEATFAVNGTHWHAKATTQLDYWVTAGDTPARIVQSYADATGHVPMMPEYGLGFWQCKLRYWNQQQVLDVAREYARRGIPVDVFVIDFFHWPKMGDFRFEEEFWPDPSAMVAELESLGMKTMVSVWPQVSLESENYDRMRHENFLAVSDRGLDVHMAMQGPSAFFDPTNPAAREFLWETVERNYGAHGIDLYWLDEAEPEWGLYDFEAYRYHAGSVLEVGNIYPQQFSRTFFDGRARSGDREIVNLVRAAWAGSQRYGALVWSGDVDSNWSSLRRQITAAIHMGVAGIAWFTTDIGGFYGARGDDPEFHELLVRWFQFGAFSPVMRLHGVRGPEHPVVAADGTPRMNSGADNELWSFGEPVYRILRGYVLVRERLRSYLREIMREAHTSGLPLVRGLFLEFPDDPRAWEFGDQYLFGSELLVAPVLVAGARERDVYLPQGARWRSLVTGDVYDGGQVITVAAPLEVIPVFAREGGSAELEGLFADLDG